MTLEFKIQSVESATAEILAETTRLINVSNDAKVRIFPNDRLRPDTLANEYDGYLLVRGLLDGEFVAAMTCKYQDHGLKIELLAVVPNCQGLGLSSQMLAKADEIARETGQKCLWLEAADLGGLVGHYLKLGFVEFKRVHLPQGYWDATEDFDLVSMSRMVQ